MKERIEYVDAMRGLAMMMVVVSHVCTGSFGNHPIFDTYINQAVQIPLFFLISGFFAPMMLRKPFAKIVTDKFMRLVVPAIVMLGLWCFLFDRNFIGGLYASMKYGYWFTWVLFVFIFIYIGTEKAMIWLRWPDKWKAWTHLVVGLVVSYLAVVVRNYYSGCGIIGLLSIVEYYTYFYFVAGALLFARRETLLTALTNKNLMGGVIVVYICLQIYAALYGIIWLRSAGVIYNIMMHTASLLIIWVLFHKYTALITTSTIGKFLSLVGRRSLDIYLIHYFFLPDLHVWGDYFLAIDVTLIEYLCAVILAIVLTYISLGVGCIFRLSPLTARVFLGVVSSGDMDKKCEFRKLSKPL